HLYEYLSQRPPYVAGDEVQGRIYEFGHDFGTFVAVADKYSAMIPKHEDMSAHRIGDVITARIAAVKEDGKLDLTVRQKAYLQTEEDAESVYRLIEEYAGVLPFSEKASPEVILRETGLSKNAFKRAVGRLYKERKVTIEDGKIRLNPGNTISPA
ncbi:MAG: RNA-binding protein, partial [Lachnospiraceae bacterium]|nr:RNA-binding protein [Lachnospiraceae bacterium]